ncbi:MBL fold metallo-hydrolase [Roseateles sp. SL47]|uniref:ComEC/Rec2 family competence protein n=1 Tax=Roseateles sp. SL47 TaxID=2995138 RepID=UPI002271CDEE|nr:MBL fold metallo-hydrolase [Roseateles sp. SL47]WAC73541.1 MBL fold metallo-hydrolase [Roseateles sp. SL47]
MLTLHVLGADYGDCLWIEYGDPAKLSRILVDAGTPGTLKRLKPLLEAVRSDVPSHELLVVTHVDEDHIGGSLRLIGDPELAAQFEHVWFNGRRHLLEATEEEDFGPVQGEKLTTAIKKSGIPWNEHFDNGPVARAVNGSAMQVELYGGATLTLLTPSRAKLSEMLGAWDKAIKEAGLDPNAPAEPVQIADGEEALGPINMKNLADSDSKDDKAPANGSSIGLLFEYEKWSILLGADAHPDDLLAGIREYCGDEPLKVDVFKLPHHGSKANVTSELLKVVDAKKIVFSTNGKRFNHPDREAVARVIRRYKDNEGTELIFNYDTTINGIWRDKGLQRDWKYTAIYGINEAGYSIVLKEDQV